MCLRTEISCIPWGNNILSEKKLILEKTIHQLSVGDVKMLLPTGKIRKAYEVRNSFVYMIDEIPAIFSNLESGAHPNFARAYCVLRL